MEDSTGTGTNTGAGPNLGPGIGGLNELTQKQRHQMKHRELFLSRQVETMPATHIRGKCCVTLLNETESLLSYLNKEDSFFYCLVFDPSQRTLLADKGMYTALFRNIHRGLAYNKTNHVVRYNR